MNELILNNRHELVIFLFNEELDIFIIYFFRYTLCDFSPVVFCAYKLVPFSQMFYLSQFSYISSIYGMLVSHRFSQRGYLCHVGNIHLLDVTDGHDMSHIIEFDFQSDVYYVSAYHIRRARVQCIPEFKCKNTISRYILFHINFILFTFGVNC